MMPSPEGWRDLLQTLRFTGSLPLFRPAIGTEPEFSGSLVLIERQTSRRFLGNTALRLRTYLHERSRRIRTLFQIGRAGRGPCVQGRAAA